MQRFAWLLPPIAGAVGAGVAGILGFVVVVAFFSAAPVPLLMVVMAAFAVAGGLAVGLPVKAAVKRADERR